MTTLHTPEVTWSDIDGQRCARWLSPSSQPPASAGAGAVGDQTTAAAALARARVGEGLVYRGDYHNARQLLAAMARRLGGRGPGRATDPGSTFRRQRSQTRLEHEVLSRLLVPIGAEYRVDLLRAPDVQAACEEALGPPPEGPGLLPLRDLLGILGAHEWRRRGVEVPALGARVHPHYGVFAPIRGEHVDLVARAAERWPVTGKTAIDVGTGTGVLALVLARRGATVIATDLSPRAVACARENAAALGLAAAVDVREADLFPGESAELVISNPPWLPAEAHTLLDRAVYDPAGRFLERLVADLPAALRPGGEGWIVISDLAELLGLRPAGHVEALAARSGLVVSDVLDARPSHPRARDRDDALHEVRSREVTRLLRLRRG
jgi:SAM-dependent methyltransferase